MGESAGSQQAQRCLRRWRRRRAGLERVDRRSTPAGDPRVGASRPD